MTKDEALRLALKAMKVNNSAWKHLADSGDAGYWEAEEQGYYQLNEQAIIAVEAALEAKDEPWAQDDMAYRPNGLPQEFIKHEVELPEDWSEWVCPNPDEYFMKCCDCGLVHEMQFKVAKYSEGDECEFVEDANLQAVFRARRTTLPQRTWVGLTDKEVGGLVDEAELNSLYASHQFGFWTDFARAIEAKLKQKNFKE